MSITSIWYGEYLSAGHILKELGMVENKKDIVANVLKFAEAQDNSAEEGAFGATISRTASRKAPANEQVIGFLDRLILDQSLPVYVSSVDGTLIHVNQRFEELSDLLTNVSLAPGPIEVLGKVSAPSIKPIINDILASKTTVRAEEKVTVNGIERIFLGRHMPVCNEIGDVVAVAGTYEDVTKHIRGIEDANRTQVRFQDFARASSDWFWEVNSELKITTLSDRFTAIVGQPAMMFIGSQFEQFGAYTPNMEGRNEGAVAFLSRKPFREQLFIMEDMDGKEQKFHLAGVPVFDRVTGDFSGYRGVGKDVNQRYQQAERANEARVQLETALADLTRNNMALDVATQQAQTALKTKNEFLAAMSHELRTPLNAIIGFAESFVGQQFGPLSEDYLKFSSDIHSSGKHLLELINDILDVAVMESGGLSLFKGDISLQTILDKAVHMNVGHAQEKMLNIIGLSISTDLIICADERRTLQIFVNLLSNAIKFTPNGGEVGIQVAETDDNFIEITVWDTGIGISREQQSKAFEKFHQITEDVYSRSQDGSGLGLHISRGLARAMNGDIRVESIEGRGSQFTVSLPKGEQNQEEDFNFI